MRKILGLAAMTVLSVSLLSGCFWDKEAETVQSMEEIYKKEGVPVKVVEIIAQRSSEKLKYSATLAGRTEALAFAKMADVVQEVHYNIGDYVHKDQIVVTFPQDNQSVQYYQAKAAYELAAATKERVGKLFEKGLVSRQEADSADTNYEVTKANLNAINSVIKVKAPISGYITQLNVKPSDNVNVGTPLFTVSNLDKIEAKLWVSSNEIKYIKVGQRATVKWNNSEVDGKIIQVSKVMNLGYKAFEVRAMFDNSRNLLTSGVTADVTVESDVRDDVIRIDRKTVSTDGEQSYVYVVEDNQAVRRDITIERSNGLTIEVSAGLSNGDILVAERSLAVVDGVKVKIITE